VDALFPVDANETPVFTGTDLTASGGNVPFINGDADMTPPGRTGGEIILPLDKIVPNPNQPRKNFDQGALQELADSIKEHGIIEPPLVEDMGDGNYLIIAGERRIRAARMAGLTEVPALIRAYSEEKRMAVSLIENIQRADLNPVEEAGAYKRLMELTGLSQDEVAARVGKNRSTVTNTLRLLKLPDSMLNALVAGTLSSGHGRALLSVENNTARDALFREITGKGLSVREAEKQAAALNGGSTESGATEVHILNKPDPSLQEDSPQEKPGARPRDPELAAMEQRFIDTLGTKVTINGDLRGGSIKIDYYSMDDLDRLLGVLGQH
jgi:ParB family chromosome partitioning protein